ncbi:hypothetical protein HYS48_05380 [Candidatus Woesearchaeota archaeon]|nr:hypothetical protein [Candidatus Woesearchaeota archaeon]
MLTMQKKGDITFTQIVYAALALVILVVLIMIFTGQFRRLGEKYEEVGESATEAATKTGWCISTITAGARCSYDASCVEIASQVGGSLVPGFPKATVTKDECKNAGEKRYFSEKENKFCCVKIG